MCDADSTSYSAADLLRRVNSAYEEIVGKIIVADGVWQFDDTNFSSLPIGTTDLVNNQQDYSFDSTQLMVERVQVKDNAGTWHLLYPLDETQIPVALDEYQKTAGLPIEYTVRGSSMFLYPPPATGSVTLTAGLKVFYQRTADVFTSAQVTTGTKVPGFASPYHMLICYKAALPYCMSYKKDRVGLYEKKAMDLEKDMLAYYSRRTKYVRPRLTVGGDNVISNTSGVINYGGSDSNQ